MTPFIGGRFQAINLLGIVPNARLYSYQAGGLIPQATYPTATIGGTPNSNPVICDGAGQADVWPDPALSYRWTLKTSAGVTIWDVDNWTANASPTLPTNSVVTVARVDAGGGSSSFTDARFKANESILLHAHYGFLDESQINYTVGQLIVGHASFNDNVTFSGATASDHHHSFQSYPHYGTAATINRLSGFWCQTDITAGTVTQLSQFHANDPLGAGTITNLYGFYCAPLVRGAGNSYAYFSEGQTKSCFGGDVQLGVPSTPATVKYDYTTGNLQLIPRTTYKVQIAAPLLIGTIDPATSGLIEGIGDFTITPRATYKVQLVSSILALGTTVGTSATIDQTTGDFVITPRATYKAKVAAALDVDGPVVLKSYTVASLPSAATYARAMIYVSNETGGATPAFSDGTNWRRVADRTIVA